MTATVKQCRTDNTSPRPLWRGVLAIVPLLLLLVGSCKTEELPGAYGSNAGPEQFRLALFPDQHRTDDSARYHPARGYVQRARTYVAGAPETLELLTSREITYLFGRPAWERRDALAGARVVQYVRGDCVVDFYFYEDAGDDALPVSYADVRNRHAARPLTGDAQSNCLRAVMRTAKADRA